MGKAKHRILIVDDVEVNRALLRTIFKDEYNIIEVENGEQAISALSQHTDIFAVVLDLLMPVMDGYTVIEAMSNNEEMKDIPVIVVTGSDDEKSQIKALNLGAVDVITKPYSPEIVKARVKNAVYRRDSQLRKKESELIKFKYEQQQSELQKSRTDEISGLYSKQFFYTEAIRILEQNPEIQYTMGLFDIDRFKVFNDIFGYAAGNQLLSDIGIMLHGKETEHVIATRLEADHFAALFESKKLHSAAAAKAVQNWFDQYPVAFDFSVKMGFYEIDDRTTDASVMCDRAMLALRTVKNSVGLNVGYYDNSLRQKLLDEQKLLSDINTAFEQQQFHVWFQPQYDYSNGMMSGAEALVRWIHPERGIIPAYNFIHIMETNGTITRLDEYVWEHCCMHLREWLDKLPKGATPPPISTNISRADLMRTDLADIFERLTAQYNIPRHLLNLEITESAYMDDSEQLISTVQKLRDLGYTLEMDDFGAGYSSLNTLKDVPVDILKLDMKFIAGAQNTPRGGSILSSVIRMARWLKMPVIAEGVETKDQADFLKSIGCRFMQGYLFSKPMSAQDFESIYLTANTDPMKIKILDTDIKEVEPFLNAVSQTALLFNSFLGGAAIFEYSNGNIEILRANDRYFSLLNTSREEYEPWMTHIQDRLVSDKDRDAIIAKLESMTEAGEEIGFESESNALSSGNTTWLRSQIKLLAKNEVSSIFYLGIENITTRKLAEQEVHKQDAMLESLYNAVPSGILRFSVSTDKELTLISYNESVWRLLNFTSEEDFLHSPAYEHIFSCIFPDDLQSFLAEIKTVIDGTRCRHSEIEHRIIWSDGNVRWIHSTIQNIAIETGERYLQCVFNDITEHREIKTQRYAKSLLKFFDEVIEVDFGRMTYTLIDGTNDEVYNIRGTDFLDQLMLDRVNTVVHPDDRNLLIDCYKEIGRNISKPQIDIPKLEYRVVKEDKTVGWHSLFLMYVDSARYLCCISDISKQKEEEKISNEHVRLSEQIHARQTESERNRFLLNSFGYSVISYDVKKDVLEFYGQYNGVPVSYTTTDYIKKNKLQCLYNVHPDDRELIDRALRKAAEAYQAGTIDFRQKSSDGYCYVRLNYTSFSDENDRIFRVFGIASEVHNDKSVTN